MSASPVIGHGGLEGGRGLSSHGLPFGGPGRLDPRKRLVTLLAVDARPQQVKLDQLRLTAQAGVQVVASLAQPLRLDVEVADRQQQPGGELVGVKPHRGVERADRLDPAAVRHLFAADQEMILRIDGGRFSANASSRAWPSRSPALCRQSARRRW